MNYNNNNMKKEFEIISEEDNRYYVVENLVENIEGSSIKYFKIITKTGKKTTDDSYCTESEAQSALNKLTD
jgi:hypothetical protein